MRTHPKIAAILKRSDLSAEYRKSVELADDAHKTSRAYHGSGSNFVPTPSYVLCSMHASLIIAGTEKVNGMEADVWIMRAVRELKMAEELTERNKKQMPKLNKNFITEGNPIRRQELIQYDIEKDELLDVLNDNEIQGLSFAAMHQTIDETGNIRTEDKVVLFVVHGWNEASHELVKGICRDFGYECFVDGWNL